MSPTLLLQKNFMRAFGLHGGGQFAGAPGVPSWVLAPNDYEKLWYWAESKTHAAWYPRVKVFRQNTIGAWNDVFAQIARAIAQSE
jgi:hypothetical protein